MNVEIYLDNNLLFKFNNNIKFNYDLKLLMLNKSNTSNIADLVFPEKTISNVWDGLKSRPFKICPINKEKLLCVLGDSILNICIFNELSKIIGFVVVTDKQLYYWIEILCTNIKQGIGTIIIDLLKLILHDKPIRLKSTFNSEKFYIKKNFIKINGDIMQYN